MICYWHHIVVCLSVSRSVWPTGGSGIWINGVRRGRKVKLKNRGATGCESVWSGYVEGVSPAHWGGVYGGSSFPPQKMFKIFWVSKYLFCMRSLARLSIYFCSVVGWPLLGVLVACIYDSIYPPLRDRRLSWPTECVCVCMNELRRWNWLSTCIAVRSHSCLRSSTCTRNVLNWEELWLDDNIRYVPRDILLYLTINSTNC